MQSRGELDLQVSKHAQLLVQALQTCDASRRVSAQADAQKRKLRLQQVLEQQRRLGHFEASKECGAVASAGDQPASEARKKQRQHEAPREKGAPRIALWNGIGDVALRYQTHAVARSMGADHAIGVKQQGAVNSAEDESRRLREREAALVRARCAAALHAAR